MPMKTRFRLIYRGERGRQFYCVDSETGRRFSLKTKDRDAAEQIVLAKNQSLRQPTLNLQIAKAYLAGTDNGVATRTWQNAIEALTDTKRDANKDRWRIIVAAAQIELGFSISLLSVDLIFSKFVGNGDAFWGGSAGRT